MTGVAENQVNVKFSFKNSCSELSIYFIYISLFIVYLLLVFTSCFNYFQSTCGESKHYTFHFKWNYSLYSIRYRKLESWLHRIIKSRNWIPNEGGSSISNYSTTREWCDKSKIKIMATPALFNLANILEAWNYPESENTMKESSSKQTSLVKNWGDLCPRMGARCLQSMLSQR